MNRRTLLALAPVAAGVSALPALAATPAPLEVVEAFHKALGEGDAAAVSDLLLDDAVIFEQGGAEASKAEYVEVHLPGDIAYSRGVTDTVNNRRSDVRDGVAWVLTQGRTTGAYQGKPVDRLTVETMLLRRTGAGWRIAHIHWSSRAAPSA